MKTSPPFQWNTGQALTPLPYADWINFTDLATATQLLEMAQVVVPNAKLYDLINTPPDQFPPGIGPLPLALYPTVPNTTISWYVIYGTLGEAPQASVTGTIEEIAGVLDHDRNPPYGALERSLGGLSSETPAGTPLKMAVYDSPDDEADPELYFVKA